MTESVKWKHGADTIDWLDIKEKQARFFCERGNIMAIHRAATVIG
jgi:hypothetical protein